MSKNNTLTVIESGQIKTYCLDDQLVWKIGRPAKDNVPDIKMYAPTISRKHGSFKNIDGVWFYVDGDGKNGTILNEKRIKRGLSRRMLPIMLNDGDIFIFGGGEEPHYNTKTVWALYTQMDYSDRWNVEDTKGITKLRLIADKEETLFVNPKRGMVVKRKNGIAIYMGDITYLLGDIKVTVE